jgi:regulatory protein
VKNDLPEKARNYAFLLLKFRLRSVKEMRERLSKKKFPADVIETVLGQLQEKQFLDDRVFARGWITSRASRRFGPGRIRSELRVKGIAPEMIEEGLKELAESRPEQDEIRRLAEEKFRKLMDSACDPRTAKRRLYAYFLRRGFSPDIVNEAIHELE